MIVPNAARLTLPKDLSKRKRHSDKCRRSKANELPFCQIKRIPWILPSSGHEGREYMLPNKNLLSVSVH